MHCPGAHPYTVAAMSRDDISDEERRLFREAVDGVKPLRHEQRDPAQDPRRPPRADQRAADDAEARAALASGALDDPEADLAEELFHARPGLQRRVLRRLRRGQFAIQAELDLHGMTRPEARVALDTFLRECRDRGAGCVRIIHGKGRRSSNEGPILKPAVAGWLRRRAEVLAFCSARPVDGGGGALYVLLSGR